MERKGVVVQWDKGSTFFKEATGWNFLDGALSVTQTNESQVTEVLGIYAPGVWKGVYWNDAAD